MLRTSSVVLGIVAAAAPFVSGARQEGWRANPENVRRASAQPSGVNYDEALVPRYTLPDPLDGPGGWVSTTEAWARRRGEVLELFRQYVYGRSPGRPEQLRFEPLEEDPRAMGGSATLKRIAVISSHAGRTHRFELTLFLPNAGSGTVPVFLLLNNRPASNTDPTRRELSGFWPAEAIVARGYGAAALQNGDIAPDDKARFREGAIRLFEEDAAAPRRADAWGALAAWGWGASRAMDYLQTDARVNAARVAIVGHSRGGKAALWAGAEDERFALVVSNDSGEGGAALARREYGETLARITTAFPHWFAPNYSGYAGRERELPVDQHMLLALMAPRALYVASADEDLWADPRGEFLSQVHASDVYALYGEPRIEAGSMPPLNKPLVAGRRGYHVRTGPHNLTPYDWDRFMDFADTLWSNRAEP